MKGKERSKWPVHENESKFSKPNIPREEKKKGESKTNRGTTFFLFLLLFFFFFFCFGEVAKHDFYGIVLQSGSVKSSQVS